MAALDYQAQKVGLLVITIKNSLQLKTVYSGISREEGLQHSFFSPLIW
jgi:hypothetical protein